MDAVELLETIRKTCYSGGSPHYEEMATLVERHRSVFTAIPCAVESIERMVHAGKGAREETAELAVIACYQGLIRSLDLQEKYGVVRDGQILYPHQTPSQRVLLKLYVEAKLEKSLPS